MADPSDSAEAPTYISYEEWGRAFYDRVVTEQRVLGAVNNLAGQPIELGPMGVGPGKIAQVKAKGSIGQASSEALPGDDVAYRVVLPVELTFVVDLQVDSHTFHAKLDVPLILTARAAAPLAIVIDITPPLPNQVGIQLKAEGLRASMLNKVIGIEGELQRFVAKYVAREVEKPAISKVRVIDVLGAVEGAWRNIGPKEDKQTARTVAADLETAIVEEIVENEDRIEEFLPQGPEDRQAVEAPR